MRTRIIALLILFAALQPSSPPVLAQEGEPREVSVALLLADLTEVDGASQTFTADVYMIAKWRDPALADPSAAEEIRYFEFHDVWHPTLVMYNLRSASKLLPEEVLVRRDGRVSYLQRFVGEFSDPMHLEDFPRDTQEFSIRVVAATGSGANVTLNADQSLGVLRAERLSVSDWDILETTLFEEPLVLGGNVPNNPGVTLEVVGKRRVTYYTIQVLIPLIAIVMMAYAVFWVAPSVIPVRVGVVVTTMLTLIAYRFMLANHVPKLPYLTRLDWFMLGATMLVTLALGTMAGTSYLVSRDKEELVAKIDRVARVLYPAALAVYSFVAWYG